MRSLYRWNNETQSLEELVEYRGKPRPSVAPAIHCDDIIGGEYRDTTGKTYYSRSAMIKDLEAAGSVITSAKDAVKKKPKTYHSSTDWEKEVTQTYYALRDGMAPRLPEKELKIIGDE